MSTPDLRQSKVVVIDYTNHRGTRSERRIEPRALWFGTSEWHTGRQWFLNAEDVEKKANRDFAMSSIHGWTDGSLEAEAKPNPSIRSLPPG